MLTNFHTHTRFCDGKNTPEEMVLTALEKGFSALGFSGHGYTPFDLRYCLKDTPAYIAEVNRLKEAYRGQIEIFLGIEEDALSPAGNGPFAYRIGSCHYLLVEGEYHPLDSSRDHLLRCLSRFGGDPAALAECYFDTFCGYIRRHRPEIIGHFDLITKFDEADAPIFSDSVAYRRIAVRAAEEIARSGGLIEVNTGAMARGLRTSPYPAAEILHIVRQADAPLILSSDCHDAKNLDFGFAEARSRLRELGFRRLFTLTETGAAAYEI